MWQSIFKGVMIVGKWCIGHQATIDAVIGAFSQVQEAHRKQQASGR